MRSSAVIVGALITTLASTAMADPPPAQPPPAQPPPAMTSSPPASPWPPPPGPADYPPPPPPPGAPLPYPYPPAPMPGSPFDPSLQVPMKTHSYPLMGGGIAITSIGVVSLLGGGAVIMNDLEGGGDFKGLATIILGVPLVVHGLGCIGGGIPMIVIGARKIPLYSPTNRPALLPLPMIGTRSATLRWTF